MNKALNKTDLLLAILSFTFPFALYIVTSANTLMFDDSAEFATVISLGSIAHPPGTPAYILIAMMWESLSSMIGAPVILSLTYFSGFCISLASFLLFLSFRKILVLSNPNEMEVNRAGWVAFFTALAFAVGPTTWAWANNIEVYAFQCLAMAITLFGLVYYNDQHALKNLFLAGFGIALGFSNHHVTMVFFLPFVPFFFIPQLFEIAKKENSPKKKTKEARKSFFIEYLNVLGNKKFWLMAGIAGVCTLAFYGWLFIRAQNEYLFMFSKPDTLDALFFHVRGGAYTKNLTDTSKAIISARVPFFLKLTMMQIGLLVPFLFLGIYSLIKRKQTALLLVILSYFFILFIYQINNNQWASTDAYMLLPFMVLMIAVLFGIREFFTKWKLTFIIPILLIVSVVLNFSSHNRKTYPVGKELMQLLDKSCPQNSVVLISDWTTVMLYNYYRLVENFRPDLIVLNYDIKFTHYRILPLQYPKFYKAIASDYDAFIDELRKEHPYQVITTGCDLSTVRLMDLFKKLVGRIETVSKNENRAFLTDPRAHVFYMNQKIYNPNRYVSGCFMSTVPGDSSSSNYFLDMDFKFLKSPLLFEDAGALDKLVDFQAMLDQHSAFYKANSDIQRLARSESTHTRIMKLQREMKKSMSFAYKIK
ncbi:MAG: DUF2723 domain-containing protein [Bacteroidetes bacterium]|nr:MAG: DUF2723 domain-containing protein [Bacteroidota bacterium]